MNKMFLNVFVRVILKKNCELFVALVALQNLFYKQLCSRYPIIILILSWCSSFQILQIFECYDGKQKRFVFFYFAVILFLH